jgi:MinD superfamily P-loop ATPase
VTRLNMYIASHSPNRKLKKDETGGTCNIHCQIVNACTIFVGKPQLYKKHCEGCGLG